MADMLDFQKVRRVWCLLGAAMFALLREQPRLSDGPNAQQLPPGPLDVEFRDAKFRWAGVCDCVFQLWIRHYSRSQLHRWYADCTCAAHYLVAAAPHRSCKVYGVLLLLPVPRVTSFRLIL
jgi:hypothetical protein